MVMAKRTPSTPSASRPPEPQSRPPAPLAGRPPVCPGPVPGGSRPPAGGLPPDRQPLACPLAPRRPRRAGRPGPLGPPLATVGPGLAAGGTRPAPGGGSPRVRHRPVDPAAHRRGDLVADRGQLPPGACVVAIAPPPLEPAASR